MSGHPSRSLLPLCVHRWYQKLRTVWADILQVMLTSSPNSCKPGWENKGNSHLLFSWFCLHICACMCVYEHDMLPTNTHRDPRTYKSKEKGVWTRCLEKMSGQRKPGFWLWGCKGWLFPDSACGLDFGSLKSWFRFSLGHWPKLRPRSQLRPLQSLFCAVRAQLPFPTSHNLSLKIKQM